MGRSQDLVRRTAGHRIGPKRAMNRNAGLWSSCRRWDLTEPHNWLLLHRRSRTSGSSCTWSPRLGVSRGPTGSRPSCDADRVRRSGPARTGPRGTAPLSPAGPPRGAPLSAPARPRPAGTAAPRTPEPARRRRSRPPPGRDRGTRLGRPHPLRPGTRSGPRRTCGPPGRAWPVQPATRRPAPRPWCRRLPGPRAAAAQLGQGHERAAGQEDEPDAQRRRCSQRHSRPPGPPPP